MSKHLRELYKRVHPDRFHSHPVARDANEKSFKLLQVIPSPMLSICQLSILQWLIQDTLILQVCVM